MGKQGTGYMVVDDAHFWFDESNGNRADQNDNAGKEEQTVEIFALEKLPGTSKVGAN